MARGKRPIPTPARRRAHSGPAEVPYLGYPQSPSAADDRIQMSRSRSLSRAPSPGPSTRLRSRGAATPSIASASVLNAPDEDGLVDDTGQKTTRFPAMRDRYFTLLTQYTKPAQIAAMCEQHGLPTQYFLERAILELIFYAEGMDPDGLPVAGQHTTLAADMKSSLAKMHGTIPTWYQLPQKVPSAINLSDTVPSEAENATPSDVPFSISEYARLLSVLASDCSGQKYLRKSAAASNDGYLAEGEPLDIYWKYYVTDSFNSTSWKPAVDLSDVFLDVRPGRDPPVERTVATLIGRYRATLQGFRTACWEWASSIEFNLLNQFIHVLPTLEGSLTDDAKMLLLLFIAACKSCASHCRTKREFLNFMTYQGLSCDNQRATGNEAGRPTPKKVDDEETDSVVEFGSTTMAVLAQGASHNAQTRMEQTLTSRQPAANIRANRTPEVQAPLAAPASEAVKDSNQPAKRPVRDTAIVNYSTSPLQKGQVSADQSIHSSPSTVNNISLSRQLNHARPGDMPQLLHLDQQTNGVGYSSTAETPNLVDERENDLDASCQIRDIQFEDQGHSDSMRNEDATDLIGTPKNVENDFPVVRRSSLRLAKRKPATECDSNQDIVGDVAEIPAKVDTGLPTMQCMADMGSGSGSDKNIFDNRDSKAIDEHSVHCSRNADAESDVGDGYFETETLVIDRVPATTFRGSVNSRKDDRRKSDSTSAGDLLCKDLRQRGPALQPEANGELSSAYEEQEASEGSSIEVQRTSRLGRHSHGNSGNIGKAKEGSITDVDVVTFEQRPRKTVHSIASRKKGSDIRLNNSASKTVKKSKPNGTRRSVRAALKLLVLQESDSDGNQSEPSHADAHTHYNTKEKGSHGNEVDSTDQGLPRMKRKRSPRTELRRDSSTATGTPANGTKGMEKCPKKWSRRSVRQRARVRRNRKGDVPDVGDGRQKKTKRPRRMPERRIASAQDTAENQPGDDRLASDSLDPQPEDGDILRRIDAEANNLVQQKIQGNNEGTRFPGRSLQNGKMNPTSIGSLTSSTEIYTSSHENDDDNPKVAKISTDLVQGPTNTLAVPLSESEGAIIAFQPRNPGDEEAKAQVAVREAPQRLPVKDTTATAPTSTYADVGVQTEASAPVAPDSLLETAMETNPPDSEPENAKTDHQASPTPVQSPDPCSNPTQPMPIVPASRTAPPRSTTATANVEQEALPGELPAQIVSNTANIQAQKAEAERDRVLVDVLQGVIAAATTIPGQEDQSNALICKINETLYRIVDRMP